VGLYLGTAGNDTITGDPTDDTINGDAGDDHLVGGEGDDIVSGDEGDDYLDGWDGVDTLIGGAGNDTIWAGGGAIGAEEDIVVFSGNFADYVISFSAQSNTYAFIDLVADRDGTDQVFHVRQTQFADGARTLDELHATIYGKENHGDNLSGSDGAESIYGYSGWDEIHANGGNDHVYGGEGWNMLDGGAGDDTLEGGADNDFLQGGEGNDTVYGGGGENTLFMTGNLADYTVEWDLNVITITDTVSGRDGTDVGYSINYVKFADGTVPILYFQGDDIEGTAGNDTLIGTSLSEVIRGNGGDDRIVGGDGSDSLVGGDGNDSLYSDAFVAVSNPLDLPGYAVSTPDASEDSDSLIGGAGDDTFFAGYGDHIDGGAHTSSGDRLNISFIAATSGVDADFRLLQTQGFLSVGGATITNIQNVDYLEGSDFDDTLANTSTPYSYLGVIYGRGGDDHIIVSYWTRDAYGDEGDDLIDASGDFYSGVLSGGSGNDTIFGGHYGTFDGGDGHDWIQATFAGNFLGGEGNDTLRGGQDSNLIDGGAGDDELTGGGYHDTLVGGSGTDRAVFANQLSDYVISYSSATGVLTVNRMNGAVPIEIDLVSGVEIFQFADQVVSAGVMAAMFGSGGNDLFAGTDDNDIFKGLAGDDTLNGLAGNDTLDGGTGNDLLDGGDGIDTATYATATGAVNVNLGLTAPQSNGPAGTDTLNSIENLVGSSQSDTLTGSAVGNVLVGGNGHDRMDGSTGADTLYGGAGNDIYFIDEAGDVVIEYSAEGLDTVHSTSLATTLGSGLETLYLSGSSDAVAVGNELDNTIGGNSGANHIDGAAGNDSLGGGTGNDSVEGGAGNDTLDGGTGADTLLGGEGDDRLSADSRTSIEVDADADAIFGGSGLDDIAAGYGDNVDGGAGFDKISVNFLAATEGIHADFRLLASGGSVTIGGGTITGVESAYDLTGTQFDDFIAGYGSDWGGFIDGKAGDDHIVGTLFTFTIRGGDGNDVLEGKTADTLIRGDAGNDTISGRAVAYGDAGNDMITGKLGYGGEGNDTLHGTTGSDELDGGAGDDTLMGGGGDDALSGGDGVDAAIFHGAFDEYSVSYDWATQLFYVQDNVGGRDGLAALHGVETFQFSDGSRDAAEFAKIAGTNGNDKLSGTAGADSIYGFDGDDSLAGGSGDDLLNGGAGNDLLNGGEGLDTATFAGALSMVRVNLGLTTAQITGMGTDTILSVEHITGGDYNDSLTGNASANQLTGALGDDTLDGAGGSDTLIGGDGSDVYFVDNVADVVTELTDQGFDLINSTVTFSLADLQVEHLTLGGGLAINGTGNDFDNRLKGNTAGNRLSGGLGNDTLDGGAGQDTLQGGFDDDTYVADAAGDVLVEGLGAGEDLVNVAFTAAGTFTMGANVETARIVSAGNLAVNVIGNASDNAIYGNAAANNLIGSTGNDTLDGGAGADVLVGGDGDDFYVVDLANDVINETVTGSGGLDTVRIALAAPGTYVLAANLENAFVTSSLSGVNVTGNGSANQLTGSSFNNSLLGLAGADTLTGGGGNDTLDGGLDSDTAVAPGARADYTISRPTASDTVLVNVFNGQSLTLRGVEFVQFTDGTWEMPALWVNIASLFNDVIVGDAAGNSLDGLAGNDTLAGLAGDDLLVGGAGVDSLVGGTGSDVYVVDAAGDIVVELADEGIDVVRVAMTSGTFALAAHVENAVVTTPGTAGVALVGNALDNRLTGNGGSNNLNGGLGNDTLDGGLGNDVLVGGAGDDTYVVSAANDVVNETSPGSSGLDTVQVAFALGGTYTLSANVESAVVTSLAGGVNVTGNAAANSLTGNALNNTLSGALGNDTLFGAGGNDLLDGGADLDQALVQGARDDYVIFRPTLTETVLVHMITGERVTLKNIESVQFSDVTLAIASVWVNTASPLSDALVGTAGSDSLQALAGNDTMSGLEGNDTLIGGTGIDSLIGGAGDDIYEVDLIGDVVVELEGDGIDLVNVAFTTAGTFVLGAHIENATVAGTLAVHLLGNGLDNSLAGNAGANKLDGGAGNDSLRGGLGADTLSGGLGQDSFVFSTATARNVDRVMDFVVLDDRIVLDNGIYTALAEGFLDAAAFQAGASSVAGSSTVRIVFNTATGALLYDADGAGGAAAVQFATVALTGMVGVLTAENLLVI
jgi:Ca2+-binding RTX toxin-like protein